MSVGVFLLFSTIGFQVELLHEAPLSWSRGAGSAFLAGTIAVMWLLVGTYRAWLLIPAALVVQLFVLPVIFDRIARAGLFRIGMNMETRATMVLLVELSILMLAIGFFLFMRAIVRTVRRSQAARAELDVARSVHEFIVPPIDLHAPGARVLAQSRTSSTMGGDLVDVVQRRGEVDVFLADVSGHGVKAGIVMAMLKASVRTRLAAGGALGEILGDVNRVLADLTDPSMFATLACVRIRARQGGGADVEYALAGHLPILHVAALDGTIRELPNGSLPLGIEPDEPYAASRTTARRGDVLALMTDGLMEVQSAAGRELGFEALREIVSQSAGGSLEEMRRQIMQRVDAHGAQIDDQSLALVEIE